MPKEVDSPFYEANTDLHGEGLIPAGHLRKALTLLCESVSFQSECQSLRKQRRTSAGEELRRGLENWDPCRLLVRM